MFMAIDPAIFNEDREEIFRHLSEFMQMLRDSEKAEGHDRIYTHGEKEFENIEKNRKGGLKLNDATYEEIIKLSEKVGINAADYLKEAG